MTDRTSWRLALAEHLPSREGFARFLRTVVVVAAASVPLLASWLLLSRVLIPGHDADLASARAAALATEQVASVEGVRSLCADAAKSCKSVGLVTRLPSGEELILPWRLGVAYGETLTVWQDADGKWISSLDRFERADDLTWNFILWGLLGGVVTAGVAASLLMVRSYAWLRLTPSFLPEVRGGRRVVQ